MHNDDGTYTIKYRGEWLTYSLFHEVFDFVAEIRDDLDWDEDFAEIEKIAQYLDTAAFREKLGL